VSDLVVLGGVESGSSDGSPALAHDRIDLMGMSLDELGDFAEQVLSERRFRGKQLFKWIYKRRVTDFDAMTDIAKATRAQLKEVAHISRMEVRAAQRSRDGTIKFLWGLHDGLQVESVLIPEDTRLTLCISTQVGCPLDCDFCVTGKGGYTRNLSKAEILGQVIQAQEHSPDRDLSNIVLMGMGEPLLNLDNVVDAMETAQVSDGLDLSHRRITLSTVGLIPQMAELGKRSRINLAISLHGTTEEQRTALMPINRKYPLADLVEALKAYPLRQKKLITIEYILIRGVNDTVADAKRLVRLLRKVPAKVNLIPYNKNPFTQYERPDNPTIVAFQEVLMGAGLHTVTRLNRGGDIDAACGQLGGYKQQRPGKRRSASPKAEQGR
tara:strand:- start:1127 stop:2272 length:1146 start_codon:yes stop_codon:yes gene_type:complete